MLKLALSKRAYLEQAVFHCFVFFIERLGVIGRRTLHAAFLSWCMRFEHRMLSAMGVVSATAWCFHDSYLVA